ADRDTQDRTLGDRPETKTHHTIVPRNDMAPDPYWRYVKKIGDYSGGGGSRKWKCNFCGYEKTGSVTRVKDHLARVPCRDTGPCKEVLVQ
ncbi:hypothetical protein KP509_04G082700, partial [Ceratopteris richardii]